MVTWNLIIADQFCCITAARKHVTTFAMCNPEGGAVMIYQYFFDL